MEELKNMTTWNEVPKEGMVLTNFIQLNNNLIRAIISESGTGAACLYLLLLSHRNAKTNKCFPTLETLSREMGEISIRQVSTYLKRLNDIGAIKVDSGKSGIANNYFFPLEEFYENTPESDLAYRRSGQGFKNKPSKPKAKINKPNINAESPKPEPPTDDDFEF